MKHRRSRSRRNYRVTEAQRSATEDAYLNSLRNPPNQHPQVIIPVYGHGKKPKDYYPKSYRKKKTQISQPTYLAAPTTQKDNSAWIAILIVLAIIASILAIVAFSSSADQTQQYSRPVIEPVAPTNQSCSTQNCSSDLPDFSVSHSGNGYTIECNDGTYSSSSRPLAWLASATRLPPCGHSASTPDIHMAAKGDAFAHRLVMLIPSFICLHFLHISGLARNV